MSQNYNFLRTFTFDGKETNHLFQIAKLNIPFLSKDNEFFNVGNTDGKHFRNTRLGDYTLSIDGFVIKDNTGKNVSDSLDELKALLNSDEPKQLVFDIFPDRYFNAIFTGAEEYDATNLDYTPLTLVFDVPDALSHAIHTKSYSNVYTTGTNLVLDSEYKNPKKYMAQWARVLENKHDNSAVIQGDLSEGLPYGYKPVDQYYWVNNTTYTRRNIEKLTAGQGVSFSIEAKVNASDDDPNITKAGMVRAELWTSNPLKLVKYVDIDIPKTATKWDRYGTVINIDEQTKGVDMINLAYCLNGQASIDFSKPMMALLPDVETKDSSEPLVGARLYSNSLDFGNYDYSGNPNLSAKLNASSFSSGSGATVLDEGDEIVFTLDGSKPLSKYSLRGQTSLVEGKEYTISCEIMLESDFVGDPTGIRLQHAYFPGGVLALQTDTVPKNELNTWQTLIGKRTIAQFSNTPTAWYPVFRDILNRKPSGKVRLRNIKIEEGSTATPYQPNLLDAPYYLSKIPLGENILKPASFPINTTEYMAANFTPNEPYVQGQKYTFTMKASKASTQTFGIYLRTGSLPVGNMVPVEGLADVWQLTFEITQSHIDGSANALNVFQAPQSTKGPVNIEWAKLEKGDTRTPNINYYKYRGLATAPSSNPKDYYWSYTPGYYNAITYSPSESTIADVVSIKNNGTYRTHPKFSFTMNGENGLVGLIHQNGSILQFGNPEDVDGTIPTRQEFGLRENLYGSTLNQNIKVNQDFKSVYPNMNSNPSTPNLFQGSWNMTEDIDSATPQFATAPTQEVWHGPSMVLPIQAPSDNNRAGNFRTHIRFNFDNRSKRARGRTEVSVMDTSGTYVMGAVIRDSDSTSDSFVFEAWYKDTLVKSQTITKTVFNKTFFELVLYRTGKELLWKLTQIKSLNASNTVNDDKVIWVSWNLDEPETSLINTVGVWQMRHQNNQHVLMSVTDIQARWSATSYYQDIKNQFQDGDIVEVDVASRSLFINGSVNNTLNVVGNEWETFVCEPGETIVQPVYSSWGTKPEVSGEIRESFL